MTENEKSNVNSIGILLRFFHPMLLVLLGYFGSMAIGDIKISIAEIKLDLKTAQAETAKYYANHLGEHKTVELLYEKRLTAIETKLDRLVK